MIEPNSEAAASEYFVIAENIIPLREATAQYIINTEFTEEQQIVEKSEVKRLVVKNKNTNPLSKFFVRLSKYLDSTKSFLDELVSSYKKSIAQKKDIYASEETSQKTRTSRAKTTAQKVGDAVRSFTGGNLDDDSSLLLRTALALGIDLTQTAVGKVTELFSGKKVHGEVTDSFASPKTGSNTSKDPAWIPFPKGTRNLTFTSGFGQRVHPITGISKLHSGIDIAGPVGVPVITPISGVVTRSQVVSGYGNMVTVKSGGLEMDFAHLNDLKVNSGDKITAGTVVGGLGDTGLSSGPHLHWNVLVNGSFVDPVEWTHNNSPMVNPQVEGGLSMGKILVGEAGPEFVIPMSQMPIFAQLMIEEKIKSVEPDYYIGRRFVELGVKGEAGFGSPMASGGISGAIKFIKKHEGLGAFVPGTGGGNFLADYIGDGMSHSIKGTKRSVAYNPSTKLFSYIDTEGVDTLGYGTTFYDDIFGGSQPVKRGDTSTVGRMESIMNMHVKQIYDQYNEWYPLFKHFKPNQQAGIISYLYNRGPNAIVGYGPMRRAMNAGLVHDLAHEIEIDIESVGPKRRKEEADLLRSGPSIIKGPKIVGEGKVGPGEPDRGIPGMPDRLIQRYFRIGPYRNQSLNDIPGNDQMEVASASQNMFSFDGNNVPILGLYQPTVHYEEEVA